MTFRTILRVTDLWISQSSIRLIIDDLMSEKLPYRPQNFLENYMLNSNLKSALKNWNLNEWEPENSCSSYLIRQSFWEYHCESCGCIAYKYNCVDFVNPVGRNVWRPPLPHHSVNWNYNVELNWISPVNIFL